MVLIRLLRRRFKIIIACISVILALYLGLSVLGAAATMQLPRLPVNGSPASVGLTFQDVDFAARVDAIDLKGWFLPSFGDSVLIIIPGGFENRVDPQVDTINLAKDLVQKGYNILLFDLRGRGESGGKGLSLSNENRDIGGAVDSFLGQVEVIVKPMGRDFESITAFQGATILGDGRIALVINPAGLV